MRNIRIQLACSMLLCSALAWGQPDTWVHKSDIGMNTANAPYPRYYAAAFTLGGKGYVVGGYFTLTYKLLDTWEYDPATDVWTQRAPFPGTARYGAAGFSIGNKGYVVAGMGTTYLNDLWEYDPTTDSWTARAPMPGSGRQDAAAFVIGTQAYVTTGWNGAYMNDTWQYDPASNSWTSKAPFAGTARRNACAFSTQGIGYVGTGQDATFKRNDVWAYDPATNVWTAKANIPTACTRGLGLTLGTKGYMGHGNIDSGSNTIASGLWYEYDPTVNTWTSRAAFGPRYGGFAFAINGKGYAGGGSNNGFNASDAIWLKTFAEFDPGTNAWTSKARFGASVTMSAASCALGGKGYVQGGGNISGVASDAWRYEPTTDAWVLLAPSVNVSLTTGFGIGSKAYRAGGYSNTVVQSSVFAYDTVTNGAAYLGFFGGGARNRAVAFTIGGKAYMGTGFGNSGGNRKDIWEFDPTANTWTQKANFGGTGRYDAVAFSIGGTGYLGLGRDSSGVRNDLWAYDPLTDQWTQRASFPGAARRSASAFTIGTTGYICCGIALDGSLLNDLWAYDPVADTWSAKAPLPSSARSNAVAFALDGAGYVTAGAGAGNATDPSWLKDTWAYTGEAITLRIAPKVFLEGAYVQAQTNMRDDLRAGGLLPLVEPFSASGGIVSVGAYAATTPSVLAVTGTQAIVDHVLVELRSPTTPYAVLASKAALLQRDGDVVAMDGVSPVSFLGQAGNYRVAIRHRNHLGVMTATSLALTSTATTIDFTSTATATYGTSAQKQINGKMVMWAGDATGNGTIAYSGANNDRDPILIAVGGNTPNNAVSNVYDRRDTNLDGVIKYTGSNNDRDIILTNVGSTTPNNTRTQQLP